MTQEKKPHVHAELIKAWADGAKIQYWDTHGWVDIVYPMWRSDYTYRIKPEPIKTQRYRRWISKTKTESGFNYNLQVITEGVFGVDFLPEQKYFVRWIDEDWQEGIVVDV